MAGLQLGLGIHRAKSAPVREMGQVHLYNGEGRGKSTSALGIVLRSIGLGITNPESRVLLLRFLKGPNRSYDEDGAIQLLKQRFPHLIDHKTVGINVDGDLSPETMTQNDLAEAQKGWDIAKGMIQSGFYSVVILDELNSVLSLGMLNVYEVVRFISEHREPGTEVVITGRGECGPVLNMASLHSEFVPQPNPQGIKGLSIITGPGKGKSTSALGRLLRTVGKAVYEDDGSTSTLILQFLKGGEGYTEEPAIEAIQSICPRLVTHVRYGRKDIVWYNDRRPEDFDHALVGWKKAKAAIESGQYKLIILDELNSVADLNLLPDHMEEVYETLRNKPEDVQLIITGRHSGKTGYPAYYELAETICTIKCHRHYMENGVDLKAGVDY